MSTTRVDKQRRQTLGRDSAHAVLFGYARVSATEQNPAHQLDALTAAGVEQANIHLDHVSGAKARRPQLDLLLHRLRDGDTLVVTRLDRLGRLVVHLITLGAELRERGGGLRVLEQGIDTATAEGRPCSACCRCSPRCSSRVCSSPKFPVSLGLLNP